MVRHVLWQVGATIVGLVTVAVSVLGIIGLFYTTYPLYRRSPVYEIARAIIEAL